MGLKEELGLDEPIGTEEHECLLNILYTATMIYKNSFHFFGRFGITDAQFNVLMQLKYSREKGLSQMELSRRLVVNRASMTGIVDRLERRKLVRRVAHSSDRRINTVTITKNGVELVEFVEPLYYEGIKKVVSGLGKIKMEQVVAGLEKIRENLRNKETL